VSDQARDPIHPVSRAVLEGDKGLAGFVSREMAPEPVISVLVEWLGKGDNMSHPDYMAVHYWVYGDEMNEAKDDPVEEARWKLYWRAHADITGADDRHTPERQEDFRLWLDKVLNDPSWFIAPGVTAADRAEAALDAFAKDMEDVRPIDLETGKPINEDTSDTEPTTYDHVSTGYVPNAEHHPYHQRLADEEYLNEIHRSDRIT
jgi:hypothetical protein